MIPSIGRIVHFVARVDSNIGVDGVLEVWPAIITRVHSEECVNLTVFPDDGGSAKRSNVMRSNSPERQEGTWCWPTF